MMSLQLCFVVLQYKILYLFIWESFLELYWLWESMKILRYYDENDAKDWETLTKNN